MTVARQQLSDIQSNSYYHVINRCVRRAHLCGEDSYSGKSYAHSRQWIVDKIKALSEVFAIDICAYAFMSNHYRLVLHVDHERAQDWDAMTVIQRWYELFKGNLLVDNYFAGESLSQADLNTINDCDVLYLSCAEPVENTIQYYASKARNSLLTVLLDFIRRF